MAVDVVKRRFAHLALHMDALPCSKAKCIISGDDFQEHAKGLGMS